METDILSFIFSGEERSAWCNRRLAGMPKECRRHGGYYRRGRTWGKSEAPVVTGVSPGCPKSAADTAATTEEGEHGARAKRL